MIMTLKQIEAEAEKRGIYLEGNDEEEQNIFSCSIESDGGFKKYLKDQNKAWNIQEQQNIAYYQKYQNQAYTPRPFPPENYWRRQWRWDGKDIRNPSIYLEEVASSFSCAIGEFGGFGLGNSNTASHWDLLLQFYIQSSKKHYFKCATPTQKKWTALRKALKKVGFELRAKERSNHGKYFVEVWEYIKPRKKAKRK